MNVKHAAFLKAYLANGGNATQAAITAGYSGKTARAQGSRLLTRADIRSALERSNEKVIEAGELTATEVLRELARIVRFDPGKLVNADGKALALHEIDEDTRRAIGGIEVEQETEHHGRLHKYKPWSKPAAVNDAMRHLGLFDADNKQVGQSFASLVRAATQKRRAEKR